MAELTQTQRAYKTPEEEVKLLQGAFKGNEYLLKLVRRLFMGFPLKKDEKELIKSTFADVKLRDAVRKKIYPKLSPDDDLAQMSDIWLGMENQIFGQTRDTIYQAVFSKWRVEQMFKMAFALLENPDGPGIDISYNPELSTTDELQIGLLARNLYLSSISNGLHWVNAIANMPQETAKQVEERKNKDSSK